MNLQFVVEYLWVSLSAQAPYDVFWDFCSWCSAQGIVEELCTAHSHPKGLAFICPFHSFPPHFNHPGKAPTVSTPRAFGLWKEGVLDCGELNSFQRIRLVCVLLREWTANLISSTLIQLMTDKSILQPFCLNPLFSKVCTGATGPKTFPPEEGPMVKKSLGNCLSHPPSRGSQCR